MAVSFAPPGRARTTGRPTATRLSAPPSSLALPPGGGAVLLIDDDELVRRALARGLRRSWVVTEIGSAEAALALLESGSRFDAILCDMNLGGMSGQAFVFALAAAGDEHVERVVILSGSSRASMDSGLLEIVGTQFLEKPISFGEITAALSRLLGRHARAA